MLVLAGTGVLGGIVSALTQGSYLELGGAETANFAVTFTAGWLLLGCVAIVGFRYTAWHLVAAAVSTVMVVVAVATVVISLVQSNPAPFGLVLTAAAFLAVGVAALLAFRAMKNGKPSPAVMPLTIAFGAAIVNALASMISTLSFGWSAYADSGTFWLTTLPLLLPPIVTVAIIVLGVLPSRVTRIIAAIIATLFAGSMAVQALVAAASDFGRIMHAGSVIDLLGMLATAVLLFIAGVLTRRRVAGFRQPPTPPLHP